jgi:hypothetical protein
MYFKYYENIGKMTINDNTTDHNHHGPQILSHGKPISHIVT